MPVYQLCDLVVPNMGHPYNVHEDNPEAIGLILQMRAMTPRSLKQRSCGMTSQVEHTGPS